MRVADCIRFRFTEERNQKLNTLTSQLNKVLHYLKRLSSNLLDSCIVLFRFLPIKFKLSIIIGSVVIFVITAFSFLVWQNQKTVIMQRMTQVSLVLLKNLSESVKGDLLLAKDDKVREAVFRLIKTDIAGLTKVAVLNHKASQVAAFDHLGKEFKIEQPLRLLKVRHFEVAEGRKQFEYMYPITTQLRENNNTKNILLGIAYITFSKDAILAPIVHAQKIALGSALIVILVAIILIYVIAEKMTEQIRLLSDAAKQISQGNLDINILITSKDELGQLADEFNLMTQHLREKMQMQKFVSKYTVDMIKDSVSASGTDAKAVHQNVSVLFSDIRNFSTISEKLNPEEIVKVINVYFDLQTRIIESYNGVVDKFMGDQIMAVFQGENMADNTLRSAVEIQQQIKQLNTERLAKGLVILETGIGINSGPAVMGNMGSTHRMDYTVIGDVVNVAARLCSLALSGQIITSLSIARSGNAAYPTSRLKSITVKGRKQMIDICEVDYNKEIIF